MSRVPLRGRCGLPAGASRLLPAAAFMALLAAGCAAPPAAAPAARPDPSKAHVPLPAAAGWEGTLVIANDVGIWTVDAAKVFGLYGCPEVIGLDDKGRCIVNWSYSGKWTPRQTIEDGEWLGALAVADLDPRLPGPEVYTGGKRGNLYRIHADDHLTFDTRVIARMPGEELHTAVAGDLDAAHEGGELLVFTGLGEAHLVLPDGTPGGGFTQRLLARLPGRVRQALRLPGPDGAPGRRVAAVLRSGEVLLLDLHDGRLAWDVANAEPMGCGRIALRPFRAGAPVVLYATRDDGLVLRLEQGAAGWSREVVYAGPQGPRGIAAGRFDADPQAETLAVFGYGARVQLLTRRPGNGWTVEAIFEDLDKGHWLAAAELDGRNGTDELLCSGYSGRITLLSRPPGYALPGVPTDPDAAPVAAADPDDDATLPARRPGVPRLAVRARLGPGELPSTLRYRGGFETKTLACETLVRRDAQGALVPGLAASWSFEDGGRTLALRLRPGASFHDGTPVDAAAVALHLRRWVGLPEHAWLPFSPHVTRIGTRGDEVLLELDAPQAVLPELCAINPGGVMAPGSFNHEGDARGLVGSGPYRLDGVAGDGRLLHYQRAGPGPGPTSLELALYAAGGPDPLAALLDGAVDGVLDGWAGLLPRERLAELGARPGLALQVAPGSSVLRVDFARGAGRPTERVEVRRALAAGVDRAALVADAEHGFAEPCSAFAADCVRDWPRGAGPTLVPRATPAEVPPLRLLVDAADPRQVRLAGALCRQWRAAGLAVTPLALAGAELSAARETGLADLWLEQTWGLPYDPDLSLAQRFLPPPSAPAAARRALHGHDERAAELVAEAFAQPDPARRRALHARLQALLDEDVLLLPLYVPQRVALLRDGAPRLELPPDPYRVDFG